MELICPRDLDRRTLANMAIDFGLADHRRTSACTGVRESGGFAIENLSRVPGDA